MPSRDASREADSPVILLLAAGEGRRFGGIKQLAEIDGQPMLRRVTLTALGTGLPVLVVLGAHADAVSVALAGLPVSLIRHTAWHEGMGSSLAAGMAQLQARFPDASAVMVLLGDQPLVDTVALDRLLARHRVAPGHIIATAVDDAIGPPALFPRDCFEALAACRGDRGARAVLAAEAARVERQSDRQSLDVDTRDDLARARAALGTARDSS